MTDIPDEIWSAIVATLAMVDAVLRARHRVEATHGTAAEAAAMTALGDAINDLEEAFDALRIHHEIATKDL